MAIKVGMRGDTLIEVMLAVGIFSMVAVAVVSVMSSGTSSSQTALEATLAREEIDTQAETLRFIHRGYISDIETGNSSKYYRLWQAITDRAVNAYGFDTDAIGSYTTFTPQNCADLYDSSKTDVPNGGEAVEKGFILNPRGLIDYDVKQSSGGVINPNIVDSVLIVPGDEFNSFYNDVKFQPASTYPHLIFGTSNRADLNDALYQHASDIGSGNRLSNTGLYSADGIYLIAVKDPNATSIVKNNNDEPGTIYGTTSAYYDFYIRTCWYGTGDQSPSSISTVIRLYNPDLAKPNQQNS